MTKDTKYITQFLTDYDDSLTGETNIDPLGQLVIWSSWGQQIFHSCITSIANDVRQYTLNLIHHAVIRELLSNDKYRLSGVMQKQYQDKEKQNFKYACLIHLENIYIWSMLFAKPGSVELNGVQGIIKARQKRINDNNPEIPFGHLHDCCLLTNQISLGTNGRYKSPMMNMEFFNKNYHYYNQKDNNPWLEAEEFIRKTPKLKKLYKEAVSYMWQLMQVPTKKELVPRFNHCPDALKKAYINAFRDPAEVGKYSCDFWLGMTRLNQNAAGAIYKVILQEYQQEKNYSIDQVFKLAIKEAENSNNIDFNELEILKYIQSAEPFLSLIDLMFSGIRQKNQQTLTEFREFWHQRKLSDSSLPKLAKKLYSNKSLINSLKGTPYNRFKKLLELAMKPKLEEQIQGLLNYHNDIMQSRGQYPWFSLTDNNLLLQVAPAYLSKERKNNHWVNTYYIHQFRHLLKGLWGVAE